METTIKVVEGCFEIEITNKVLLEWRNKFHAAINRRRIIKWCNDNHIDSMIVVKEGQFFLSIKHKTPECKPCTISDLGNIFEQLVNFVDNLPEVDATSSDNEQFEKNKKFVKRVLNEWDETEDCMGIAGAVIYGSFSEVDILTPYGHISEQLLKQMFESWLQLHE